MESFIGEEKVFVVDLVLYREPVKLDEYRGDVVQSYGIDEFGGEFGEEGIAVVDSGCDK